MGRRPQNLSDIKRLRGEADKLRNGVGGKLAEIRSAEADLAAKRRRGASVADIRAMEKQLLTLGRQRDALRAELDRIGGRFQGILDQLPVPLPAGTIPGTRADTPLLLLPVRLETRYFNNGTELRVRIYPDQVHIDAHEPELTEDEIAAGRDYWQQRWTAPDAGAEATTGQSAFRQLAAQFRPRRAAWIVFAMTPTNLAPPPRAADPQFPAPAQRATPWTRAAFANLLPTRWTVVGSGTNGKEIFRKTGKIVPDRLNTGLDPADPTPVPTDAAGNPTQVPADAGMKWLIDFDTAEASGMALRIGAGDVAAGFNLARDTIARLVAYGVNETLDPAEAAARLETLLRAHAYGDGISVLRPGTPTNNSGDAASGLDSSDAAIVAALDPLAARPPAGPGIAGLARALGIDAAAAHLDRADGRDTDPDMAGHMVNILWSATLGQTMDQLLDPQLTDAQIAATRDLAVKWLRPGGPLPTLRIGSQPYGLLPVMAPAGFAAVDAMDGHLARVLGKLRGVWTAAAAKAPRLDAPGSTMAQNMEQLLQQGPMAASNRFRRAYGPKVYKNSNGDQAMSALQELARAWLLISLGIKSSVKLASLTLEANNHRLGAAFTQARIADEAELLSPDYLSAIAAEAGSSTGRAALARRGNADTLLEALAAAAVLYEFDAAASVILLREMIEREVIREMPPRAALRIEELVGIEAITMPQARRGAPPPVAITTPQQQAELVLTARTNGKPLAHYVVDQLYGRGRDADATAALRRTIDSLRTLAGRPAAEIDRQFRGVLDAYSYRIDPWLTAQASKRLAHWRGQPGSKGIGIGGFGWVEGLKHDPGPQSEDYIHAPSLQHAQAAAVLRSGHLAHRDASKAALNIDLSSRRVRLALGLLDGVAQGQSMAALLGYRLERRLQDVDLTLAKFILPLRRLFPLNPPAGQTVLGATEAIAARDVIDGVKLLDKRRAGGNWLQGLQPAPDAAERSKIDAVAAELDDMFDAVSDLLVAEGVYQLVGGNTERASAALSAMDRQTRPVDPEVVRTPRSGRAFAQRLGVLLASTKADAAWPADARSAAEPAVNAWVAGLIGKPDAVGFGARVVIPGAAPVLRDLQPITLADLKLSPLSLLMLSEPGGRGRPSDLQEHLAARFAEQVIDAERDANAELHLLPEAPAGRRIGLAAFEALLERIRAVTSKHRAMSALDIAPPGSAADPGEDAAEVQARANAVQAALQAGLDALNTQLAATPADEKALRETLLALARTGASGAMPGVAEPAKPGESDEQRAARLAPLIDQATQVAARIAALIDQAAALAADAAVPTTAEQESKRIKTLLGEAFPVLPRFTLPPALAQEAMLSLADGAALTGKAGAVLHGWLARMAEVRPRTNDLAGCLLAADVLAGTTADLKVAQFPHASGNRWIGLPLEKTTPEQVDLSLCLHAPGLDMANPPASLAGFMCDDWSELIPAAAETTAIAFHYDAPGARPPQAMLLAVHPGDKAATGWTGEAVLATINEALEQARMRSVRPQDLDLVGALLPLIYLPDNYTRDVPGIDFARIMAKAQSIQAPHLRNVLGKA